MTVGNVYEDPRGKVSRDGGREHVFVVRSGQSVLVKRYASRVEAEQAREQFLNDHEVTVIPAEVRAMIESMGLRHPLDCAPEERAEHNARLHERAASLFDRLGDTVNAASAHRAAAIARNSVH